MKMTRPPRPTKRRRWWQHGLILLALVIQCFIVFVAVRFTQLRHRSRTEGTTRRVKPVHEETEVRSLLEQVDQLMQEGRYAEAEPKVLSAIGLSQGAWGRNHELSVQALDRFGLLLQIQGKFPDAEHQFRMAAEGQERLLGSEQPETANSLERLAINLHTQAGKPELGRKIEPARIHKTIAEKKGDMHQVAQKLGIPQLVLRERLKRADWRLEAAELHERVFAIRDHLVGAEHFSRWLSRSQLATLRLEMAEYDASPMSTQEQQQEEQVLYDALTHCEQWSEAHGNSASALLATSTVALNLANYLHSQGKFSKAEPLYAKAQHIRSTQLGNFHPDTLDAGNRVAVNLLVQAKYTAAEEVLEQATTAYEESRRRAGFTGVERALFAPSESPWLYLAALLAHRGENVTAWERLEMGLSRGLLDDMTRRFSSQLTPAERERELKLNRGLQRFDGQIAALSQLEKTNKTDRAVLVALTREREQLRQELTQFYTDLDKRAGARGGKPHPLSQVQKALPEGTCFLAWVDAPPATVNGLHYASVVRKSGDPLWIQLPGSEPDGRWTVEDEGAATKLRDFLATGHNDVPTWEKRVYTQRLAPVLDAVQTPITQWIILPFGTMAGVPIEVLTPDARISYAPSATLFASLREQQSETKISNPAFLALGDPDFEPSLELEQDAAPGRPKVGAIVTEVPPGSRAAQSGLRPGDILLEYNGTKIVTPPDLSRGSTQAWSDRERRPIPVKIWRRGKMIELKIPWGPLEFITRANGPDAMQRIDRRGVRDLLEVLGLVKTDTITPLPGTRREVEAIGRLFRARWILLGRDASEQNLDAIAKSGELRRFDYVHLATHGDINDRYPLRSSLILAQKDLPDPTIQAINGATAYSGQLTAEKLLRTWSLNAELVTLSACDTGLGANLSGEGYVGFAQSLFLAGARSVVLSLWKVDDRATALLMYRFYQNLLGEREELTHPLTKVEALKEAKAWLRNLSPNEVRQWEEQLGLPPHSGVRQPQPVAGTRRTENTTKFDLPVYWAAFILIGEPGTLTTE